MQKGRVTPPFLLSVGIVLPASLHYTASMKKILLMLPLLCVPSAQAAMCKYITLDDQVILASVPIQNARKVECFGQEKPADKKARERKSAASSPTPTDFPKVDASAQQQRDNTRRRILTDELATERNALQQARQVGKLPDVALHEKNVQMLEKELSSIR